MRRRSPAWAGSLSCTVAAQVGVAGRRRMAATAAALVATAAEAVTANARTEGRRARPHRAFTFRRNHIWRAVAGLATAHAVIRSGGEPHRMHRGERAVGRSAGNPRSSRRSALSR